MMMEGKCGCGKLLMTFDEEVTGSIILICPECKASSAWQSLTTWGTIPTEEIKQDDAV